MQNHSVNSQPVSGYYGRACVWMAVYFACWISQLCGMECSVFAGAGQTANCTEANVFKD